jgi:TPP-dependent pyruvate/acetoin dehydrogenase alpha subunit
MARPGTAASKPANMRQDSVRSNSRGPLSREQKLEFYYYMRLTRSLEERLLNLPETSDIVMALRKLAAY